MSRLIKKIIIFLLFVPLLACTAQRARLVSGVPVDLIESRMFLAQLESRDREISSFKGLFKTSIRRGKDVDFMRHAIVFDRPDKIRIETLPRDAVWTLSLLVSQASALTLLEPGERKAWILSAGPETLRRVIGIPVAVEDLMSLLVGHVPHRLLDKGDNISVFRDDLQGLIGFNASNGLASWTTDASGNLQTLELSDQFNQKLTLIVNYLNYSLVGNIYVPKKVVVEMPRDGLVVELTQASVKLNTPIADKLFTAAVPSDYSVEHQLR